MKRSRACEDLRALESAASTSAFWSPSDEYDNDAAAALDSMAALSVSNSTGQLFQHRVKRSKRVDMVVDSDFCDAVSFCAFDLAIDSAAATTSSSCNSSGATNSSSSVGVLPSIRRNSRDVLPVECDPMRAALQFKKKLQLAGVEPLVLVDAPDESEMILCGRFQLDARCIDPLSKRQSSPFDLSSLIMLSNR